MIHQPELATQARVAEQKQDALYQASCELGQLIALLDMTVEVAEEDWVNPTATLRRLADVMRIARGHASRTLERTLAAEGAMA